MLAPPHIRPSEDKDAAAVLVELLKPGAWIPPAQARWLPVIEALLEAFLRHFDRRGTGPASGSPARPSAIRISAQRARREWRGNSPLCTKYVRCWRGIRAFQQRLAQHSRPWKASRRKQFRIRPSRRRSFLPCRRGQIWSWTRRIRKLLAAAWPMSFGFGIELLQATPSRSKPCARTRCCAFKTRPPYSCRWLKIALRLAWSPAPISQPPGENRFAVSLAIQFGRPACRLALLKSPLSISPPFCKPT